MTDIINSTDYKWTLNTSGDARKRCPRIAVEFLQMQTGQMQQLAGMADSQFRDQYKNLYNLQSVENWLFPYFAGQHHNNSNTWEPLNLENISNGIADAVGAFSPAAGDIMQKAMDGAKILRGAMTAIEKPAYKTETPQVWRNTTLETVSFGFSLYNTSETVFKNHRKIVRKLIYLTLPKKESFTFMQPPVLCSYNIPGIRYAPIAKVDFSVQMKGQTVFHNDVIIPDAYELSFNFSDLLIQTRNFNRDEDGPDDRVKAYNSAGGGGTGEVSDEE